MIANQMTLSDVQSIFVGRVCKRNKQCAHLSKVTWCDGRIYSHLSRSEICSIISNLSKKKINPGKTWSGNAVKEHFKDCIDLESPKAVLNRLFPPNQDGMQPTQSKSSCCIS